MLFQAHVHPSLLQTRSFVVQNSTEEAQLFPSREFSCGRKEGKRWMKARYTDCWGPFPPPSGPRSCHHCSPCPCVGCDGAVLQQAMARNREHRWVPRISHPWRPRVVQPSIKRFKCCVAADTLPGGTNIHLVTASPPQGCAGKVTEQPFGWWQEHHSPKHLCSLRGSSSQPALRAVPGIQQQPSLGQK